MGTICNDCQDSTCSCSVPSCAERLILGTVEETNTMYFVFVQKQNGASEIQQVMSNGTGQLILDLTEPNKDFYNHYDGTYLIWASLAIGYSYYCDINRASITAESNGIEYNTLAVNFFNAKGVSWTEVFAQPFTS